jgi:hypothetical protein
LESEGDRWKDQQVLVDGIPFPTALLIDDTDHVCVSVHGAFSTSGSGLIAQFDDLATRTVEMPPIPFS